MSDLDATVKDYLDRVDRALRRRGCRKAERANIVGDLANHLAEARRELPEETAAGMATLLERTGDPERLAAEVPLRGRERRAWTVPTVVASLALVVAGIAVGLSLSSGSSENALAHVPNVVGMPVNDARIVLEHAGFQVAVSPFISGKPAKPGVVQRESPTADLAVPRNTTVTLVVRRDVHLVRVPLLLDEPLNTAEAIVMSIDLKVHVRITRSAAAVEAGKVVAADHRNSPLSITEIPHPLSAVVGPKGPPFWWRAPRS